MSEEFHDSDSNEKNTPDPLHSCASERPLGNTAYSAYKTLGESIIKSYSNFDKVAQAQQDTFKTIAIHTDALINTANKIAQMFVNVVPSNYFQGFITAWSEILSNPNNALNYTHYEHQLDNFHWAWPFQFDAATIKELVETVNSEKDFDTYMVKHFSAGKDKELISAVEIKLPKSQKLLFKQAATAYKNHHYAIANNALMSILDNLLSKYLENKGQTKRYGIFKPLVDVYSDLSVSCLTPQMFRLIMLSHNIDFIFQDYRFNKKIIIDTNKKARRHPSIHGFKYSNKKADALMLINSLHELLSLQNFIKSFEGTLRVNQDKEFCIDEAKQRRTYRPLIKRGILLVLEEQSGLTNSQIIDKLAELGMCFPFVTPQYISSTLQNMRRVDHSIENKKEDGLTKWFRTSQENKAK